MHRLLSGLDWWWPALASTPAYADAILRKQTYRGLGRLKTTRLSARSGSQVPTPPLRSGGTPGSATWSLMAAGHVDGSGFHAEGPTDISVTAAFGVARRVLADYVNAINAMLTAWYAVPVIRTSARSLTAASTWARQTRGRPSG